MPQCHQNYHVLLKVTWYDEKAGVTVVVEDSCSFYGLNLIRKYYFVSIESMQHILIIVQYTQIPVVELWPSQPQLVLMIDHIVDY